MAQHASGRETIVADVGATLIRVALARGGTLGPVLTRRVAHLPRSLERGIVPALSGLISQARENGWQGAGGSAPIGVGLGICAAVDDEGRLQKPLPFGVPDGRTVVDVVRRAVDLPVAIDNDANMAALGELQYGAGRGLESFVLLTLGTNIGMGIVSGRRILRGASGGAGEAGMLMVPARTMGPAAEPPLRRVQAGPLGEHLSRAPEGFAWIEELAGGGAMARSLAVRRGYTDTAATGLRVLREAAAGDPDAAQVADLAIEGWAFAIANYVALLDPEVIILSGGLSTDIGPFLGRLRDRATALSRAEPRLVIAELGPNGGLIGASVAAEQVVTSAGRRGGVPAGRRREWGGRRGEQHRA